MSIPSVRSEEGISSTTIEDPAELPPERLKKRPDFLRAASGRKSHAALFTVQGIARTGSETRRPRVGFTVTKKVGAAVERNRIKRRLREAVRTSPDLVFKPTHDYVVVARRDVLGASFPSLVDGLRKAIRKLHGPSSSGRRSRPDTDTRIDGGTNGS